MFRKKVSILQVFYESGAPLVTKDILGTSSQFCPIFLFEFWDFFVETALFREALGAVYLTNLSYVFISTTEEGETAVNLYSVYPVLFWLFRLLQICKT